MNVQRAALHSPRVHQIDAVFDAWDTIGNLRERMRAQQLLLRVKWAMISSNRIDEAGLKRAPECGLVALVAQGGGHDVLHAFDSFTLGVGLVEEEMGDDGFDME